jgi:hypothetical protein
MTSTLTGVFCLGRSDLGFFFFFVVICCWVLLFVGWLPLLDAALTTLACIVFFRLRWTLMTSLAAPISPSFC